MFGGTYFYFKKLNNNCVADHNKFENSYIKFEEKLKERNSFIKNSNYSDSIKILAQKSDSIINATNDANKVLWTEFMLNEKTHKNDSLKSLNNELNSLKNKYNSDLKNFHTNWTIFPFNLVKIRQRFPKFNYLNIDYGENNREI